MMELSEFGRRRRAMVVPLAAVPVLAGIAGAGWTAAQPAEYRHSVDVQVPAPSAESGAAAIEQNVSTYRGLVTSTPVAQEVAGRIDVKANDVRSGLSTQRPGTGSQRGSLVRVVYIGPHRTRAPEITRAAAVAAVAELMRPSADSARQAITGARNAANEARDGLAAAAKKYGGLPTEEYRSLQNQIAQLEAERDAPSGNRSPADVRDAIASRKKRLALLAPRAIEVQTLQENLSQANRKLSDAEEVLRTIESRTESAEASIATGAPRAHQVDQNPVILRAFAISAGVGVVLAGGIILLLQVRRRPAPAARPVSPPSAGPAGGPTPAAPPTEMSRLK